MESKQKKLIMGIVLGIVFILLIFIGYNSITGKITDNFNNPVVCPMECCSQGEYFEKTCAKNYECLRGVCVEIDSDKDGLTDIEEINFGTNPQLYDSDGDTLSDYQEIKNIGTDPLKTNTDNDRYKDNEDREPLFKNSADIQISLENKEWNWNLVNILVAFAGGGLINPEMTIAEPSTTIIISNIGNDYTNYINFDMVFKLQNIEIDRKKISLNKINLGESKTEIYSKKIEAKDVPSMLVNFVLEESTDWSIGVERLEYEKY